MSILEFIIIALVFLAIMLAVQIVVFKQFSAMMRLLKIEVAELKVENKYLNDTVNEFKMIVATMIAEEHNTEEKDRIIKKAKEKLQPNAISYFKAGKMTLGLSQLETEVSESEIDEVIGLQSRFAGLSKSMEYNRISEKHFEIELNNIRTVAIKIALDNQKSKSNGAGR